MKRQGSGIGDQGSGIRRFVGPAVILLAAGVAVAPQLALGNSCGHDFDFHLVSWLDAQSSWRQGIVYPHWAASANYGAGEPRFVFYSPLTWMMGAALGFVLPWTMVPIAMTFLLLAGTGLAARALAREALGDGLATLAGCIALFSGYALFTAYERSAFAELAGGVWIPLVLLFALRDGGAAGPAIETGSGAEAHIDPGGVMRGLKSPPPSDSGFSVISKRALDGSAALLALAVAGAWLSNPTVGVMACYLLAAVALAAALLARSWAYVLRASVGVVLGIGVIAIYLVPAAWEQRWVDIRQVTLDPGQTLENNWLFAVHSDPLLEAHDEVLHTASWIAVIMIAVAVIGLVVSWTRGRLPGRRQWWIPLALIPVLVLFLQFSVSRPVWNLLPDLRFLQFPWRWLLVLEAPMGIFVASAAACTGIWRRVAVLAGCIAIFGAMTAYAARDLFQSCDDEDAVPGMLNTYRSGFGFIGWDEYEPIGADNSLVATGLPAACLVSDADVELGKAAATTVGTDDDQAPVWSKDQGSCEATFSAAPNPGKALAEHRRYIAIVDHAGYLVLRLRSYPAWLVRVNGRPVTGLPKREDGLIAVPVEQGPVDVTVDWTTTDDVLVGRWLSGVAALLLAALWWVERRVGRLACRLL